MKSKIYLIFLFLNIMLFTMPLYSNATNKDLLSDINKKIHYLKTRCADTELELNILERLT